jgi:hypothetical protein
MQSPVRPASIAVLGIAAASLLACVIDSKSLTNNTCAEGLFPYDHKCVADIDECALKLSNCDPKAHCENRAGPPGTFTCTCPTTSRDVSPAHDGTACVDIVDGCATGRSKCDPLASCTNTDQLGHFVCKCPSSLIDVHHDGSECSDHVVCDDAADGGASAPQTLCNGKCTDTKTDPMNCGSCGTQCPADCSGGKCQCPAGACGGNNACTPGVPSYSCACNSVNGWVPINSCQACYKAWTLVGTNIDCDNSQMPLAGSMPVQGPLACYHLCVSTTGCKYFTFYPATGWCNMAALCAPPYATSNAQGELNEMNPPPAGGVSNCP